MSNEEQLHSFLTKYSKYKKYNSKKYYGSASDIQQKMEVLKKVEERLVRYCPKEFISDLYEMALTKNDLLLTKVILKSKLSVNEVIDKKGNYPIHLAAMYNRSDIVNILCKEYKADVNKPNGDNHTPLFIAAFLQSYGVVEYLLNKTDAKMNDIELSKSYLITIEMQRFIDLHSPILEQEVTERESISSRSDQVCTLGSLSSTIVTNVDVKKIVEHFETLSSRSDQVCTAGSLLFKSIKNYNDKSIGMEGEKNIYLWWNMVDQNIDISTQLNTDGDCLILGKKFVNIY